MSTCRVPAAGALLGRDGQAFPPLRATAFQHETALLCAHPHKEAVCAPAAAAVRLERTFHDVGSPATDENGRRNNDTNEPAAKLSIRAADEVGRLVCGSGVCYSPFPASAVGSPPEVFHNCGKKCGKATGFRPVRRTYPCNTGNFPQAKLQRPTKTALPGRRGEGSKRSRDTGTI